MDSRNLLTAALSAAERHPRKVLALLAILVSAPGLFGIPPLDRDESYFAQAARQMLESGDFIDIRFQDEPLYEKPVFTYWAQAAAVAALGTAARDQIGAYRVPSALAVVLATLLLFELGAALFGRRCGLTAAALLACMPLVQSQAHQARADALLLAAMLACLWPLALAYRGPARGEPREPARPTAAHAAIFWSALAAAMLIKGPVVPAVLVLACAALSLLEQDVRWLARLRPRWGIPLCLFVLAPWPLALLAHGSSDFFVKAWRSDILPKLISASESHGAPPLAYAVLSPFILWPAILLLPAAIARAWDAREAPGVRFCAGVAVPGWLLFELAPTKLPHYVLPLVPVLLVLAGSLASPVPGGSRALSRLGAALFAIGGIAAVAATMLALVFLAGGIDVLAALALAAALCAVGLTTVRAWRGHPSAAGALVCGLMVSITGFGVTLPRLQRLWVTQRAADAVHAISACAAAPTFVAGYREPSLTFLLGTATRFGSADEAARALSEKQSTTAIVNDSAAREFALAARRYSTNLRRTAVIDGIDPVHARPVRLEVWSAASSGASEPAASLPRKRVSVP
jgi:4-amino-4-deoxy-L-arabinose transferase-like glycosyltransferase